MNGFKIEIIIIIALTFLLSCKHKTDVHTVNYEPIDTVYFKDLNTNKIIKNADIRNFIDSLKKEYCDSLLGNSDITIIINKDIEKKDSVIKLFTYDIRVGLDYPVRTREYPKIGMTIPEKKFISINGDSVQIGGIQDKPTVINLWFLKCGGCIAEIPALNRLQEKYADKVNFIALTFDNKYDVKNFLNKTPYNYIHVASNDKQDERNNIRPFIKSIESYPYPENIFINKLGTIKYIERGLPPMKDLDLATKHFELIIQDLLNVTTDD